MAKEESSIEEIIPGLIVRHTNRRLGRLEVADACERLICGKISFSEFVDQVGGGFRELLEFMMEHDLHPGRPEEIVYCVDCYAECWCKDTLMAQLGDLYRMGAAHAQGAKAS